MRIVPVVMPKLPSAWSTRKVNTNGGLTGELSSGLPAGSARGCVQKLAYETDKLLVSKLASLKPSDLKNASELIHDVADFAQTPVYQAYRDNPEAIFPDPVRTAVEKRWLAPHRVGFAEWSWQSVHPLIFKDIEPVYRGHRENQTALLRTHAGVSPLGDQRVVVCATVSRSAWPFVPAGVAPARHQAHNRGLPAGDLGSANRHSRAARSGREPRWCRRYEPWWLHRARSASRLTLRDGAHHVPRSAHASSVASSRVPTSARRLPGEGRAPTQALFRASAAIEFSEKPAAWAPRSARHGDPGRRKLGA